MNDRGHTRTTPAHLLAIREEVAADPTIDNTDLAAKLAARPELAACGAPLHRSTVSRHRAEACSSLVTASDSPPVQTPVSTSADASTDAEREVLAIIDAEIVASADGAFTPSGYFSPGDVVAVKKQTALRLRALVSDVLTPASVAVRAAVELTRLVTEIHEDEQKIARADARARERAAERAAREGQS